VRLLVDAVEVEPAALGAAAAQLGAEAALGATVRLSGDRVQIEVLLAGAQGEERAAWSESLPLGAATRLGSMLARAVLLALGDDALAPPDRVEPEAPADAVLRMCRAAAQLEGSEVDAGIAGLLALIAEQPALGAPRRTLIAAARDAAGGDRMPAFLSALERLVVLRPDDAEALFELAGYRALHFDEAGARELLLHARDVAEDPMLGAQACIRLAALAEQGGRAEEAIAHLRAAVRLDDDAAAYARLGALLLPRDPAEGVQALTRAAVLAPRDPEILLQLARALREHGGDPARALAAAAEAARLAESRPELADRIAAELELLLAEDEGR
jgi:tetratricopeptide (TPR) repeat protein